MLFIICFTQNPFGIKRTLYTVVMSVGQFKNRVLIYVARTLIAHVVFMEQNVV